MPLERRHLRSKAVPRDNKSARIRVTLDGLNRKLRELAHCALHTFKISPKT
jgi:hypothetical protein